jgi:hypothetical protein
MNTKHTPTPWKIWPGTHPRSLFAVDLMPSPSALAKMKHLNGVTDAASCNQARANAALIVLAVNTYQSIQDALGTNEDGEALVEVARNAPPSPARRRLAEQQTFGW